MISALGKIFKITAIGVLLFVFSLFSVVFVNAQDLGVARYLEIEEEVEDGDIISVNENIYAKSRAFYDPGVVGVVAADPALALNSGIGEGTYPVLSSGLTHVKVSAVNGIIEQGDIVTTSETPGVGAKLVRSGFALGIAEESMKSENPDEVEVILVDVQRHYAYSGQDTLTDKLQRSITDVLVLSEIATYDSPTQVLRYLIAGIIVIAAVIIGIMTFGRVARTGIEAVGRNPLASKSITFGIILNVLITIAIIAGGVGLGYLIIIL